MAAHNLSEEAELEWLQLTFHWLSGFWLPSPLCRECAIELYLMIGELDTPVECHECPHAMKPTAVLTASTTPGPILDALSREIGTHGWNRVTAFLTDDEHDLPTVH